MRTFISSNKDIERKWFLVDAEGIPLGRLATKVALLLSGKRKTLFSYHQDVGDFVIVINADKVKFTGKKYQQKTYYWHSTYPGGIKSLALSQMMNKHPDRVIKLAVKRMLPKNQLGRNMLKRLKVYSKAEHPHVAQKPEKIDIMSIN